MSNRRNALSRFDARRRAGDLAAYAIFIPAAAVLGLGLLSRHGGGMLAAVLGLN